MIDKDLNNLFDQARKAPVETKVNSVYKWLGYSSLGASTAMLLVKFKKVFILNSFVMVSSIVTVASIATIAFFSSGNPENASVISSEMEVAQKQIQDSGVLHFKTDLPESTPLIEQAEIEPASEQVEPPVEAIAEVEEITEQEPVTVVEVSEESTFIPEPLEMAPALTLAKKGDVGTFTKIEISGAMDIVLKQGSSCGVKVTGDDDNYDKVSFENKNGTLIVGHGDGKPSKKKEKASIGKNMGSCDEDDEDLTIIITFETLDWLKVSGACDVETEDLLSLEDIEIISSGASDIDLEIAASEIRLKSQGASDIDLSGTAGNLEISNTGASDVDTEDLKAENVEIKSSGASHTCVYASDSINAKVSGVSSVCYGGNPSSIDQEVDRMASFEAH